jgi:hypothetical protein
VELRPKKGVYQATLSYFIDDVTTDIPITVAPVLDAYNGKPINKLTESDLDKFITKSDVIKDGFSRDLNSDKLIDYIDDFIFIANYLVQSPQTKTPALNKELPPKPTMTEKPINKTDK